MRRGRTPAKSTPKGKRPARSGVLARRRGGFLPPEKHGREYAEQLVQAVIARRRRVAEEFYGMGVELRELARPEMHRVLGYKSFGELLEGRRIINRMTALRLISVVEAFPPGLATKLGLEKAYALVRYAEATPAPDFAKVLALQDVVVGGKRISEASVRDIVAETKKIRGEGVPDARDPAAREARGAAKALQAALRKGGAKGVTARRAWERGAWKVRVELSAEEARGLVAML
jgi:hypothetical protein